MIRFAAAFRMRRNDSIRAAVRAGVTIDCRCGVHDRSVTPSSGSGIAATTSCVVTSPLHSEGVEGQTAKELTGGYP